MRSMREEAIVEMQRIEEWHWWYEGARRAYRLLLGMVLAGRRVERMIDVGCGTGGNLPLLERFGPTLGCDVSDLGLRLAAGKQPRLGFVRASATALPFRPGVFDAVNLLGVVEHIEQDVLALSEARRVCRPGGAVVFLTSAFMVLWSHHDDANQHKRRYTTREFGVKLAQAGLRPIKLSYYNFCLFLPALIVRRVQRWLELGRAPQSTRPLRGYDVAQHIPKWINAMLVAVLSAEAFALRWVRFPFGVDIVGVCTPEADCSARTLQ